MCQKIVPRICTRDPVTGDPLVDGKPPVDEDGNPRKFMAPSFGRNGPARRKGGRPRRDAPPVDIIEPEPVDDLD